MRCELYVAQLCLHAFCCVCFVTRDTLQSIAFTYGIAHNALFESRYRRALRTLRRAYYDLRVKFRLVCVAR